MAAQLLQELQVQRRQYGVAPFVALNELALAIEYVYGRFEAREAAVRNGKVAGAIVGAALELAHTSEAFKRLPRLVRRLQA